ncbi:hypothetical protein Hanom_Chr07g00625921 [Helianthus anomalus]
MMLHNQKQVSSPDLNPKDNRAADKLFSSATSVGLISWRDQQNSSLTSLPTSFTRSDTDTFLYLLTKNKLMHFVYHDIDIKNVCCCIGIHKRFYSILVNQIIVYIKM